MTTSNVFDTFKKRCPCCLKNWEHDPVPSEMTHNKAFRIRCPSNCFNYGPLTCHADDLNDLWPIAFERYEFKLGSYKLTKLCDGSFRRRDFRVIFLEQYLKRHTDVQGGELIFLGGVPQNAAPKGYKKCIYWTAVFFNKTEGVFYSLDADYPLSITTSSKFRWRKLKVTKLLSEQDLSFYNIGEINCFDIFESVDNKYLFS